MKIDLILPRFFFFFGFLGILGLESLVFFAERYPRAAADVMKDCETPNNKWYSC